MVYSISVLGFVPTFQICLCFWSRNLHLQVFGFSSDFFLHLQVLHLPSGSSPDSSGWASGSASFGFSSYILELVEVEEHSFVHSYHICRYGRMPAKTSKINPIKNKETLFIPVNAALYAAILRNTWNANNATSNQLIHFSERLMVATF